MIEGIAPSPQQVALAELGQDEPICGFGGQARLVANNISVLRRASHELVTADLVTVSDIAALHDALLPDDTHSGLRVVQNWIGGSTWNPIGAEFVPPPAERVPSLMDDLVVYLNGSAHGPLVQAALVHAQFETIHPFTDGNGRVGRALVHTVLTRAGLTPRAILPVSLVLATLSDRYIEGLTAYRYVGEPHSPVAQSGTATWLAVFLEAAHIAVDQAQRLVEDLDELRDQWASDVAAWRSAQGLRPEPRARSGSARILELLPEVPVMTSRTVQRILGLSFPAARDALEELASAGVLTRKAVDRGTTGYLAHDVLDLIGLTERRPASTRFDTRTSPPRRPVPVRPGGS